LLPRFAFGLQLVYKLYPLGLTLSRFISLQTAKILNQILLRHLLAAIFVDMKISVSIQKQLFNTCLAFSAIDFTNELMPQDFNYLLISFLPVKPKLKLLRFASSINWA
jgi:hypothetical protein